MRVPALPAALIGAAAALSACTSTQDVLEPSALGVDVTPRLKTLKVVEPPKRKGGVKVASVGELVDKLKNEAKVI